MTEPQDLPLRDIHLPGEVPFWPPAPGWWILAALIISIAVAGWWLYRRHHLLKLSATHMAREQLQLILAGYQTNQDPRELLSQLSILLRRLSISLYPRTEVASLTGQAWLEFLDRQSTQQNFSAGTGRLLSEAPYRRIVAREEAEQVLQFCQQWIDKVGTGKQR